MSFEEKKKKKKNILTNIASIDASEKKRNMSLELSVLRALRKGELEDFFY